MVSDIAGRQGGPVRRYTAVIGTLIAVGMLVVAALPRVAGAQADTPTEIVRQTADTLAARIEGRAKQLSANPPELYRLVDEVFLPVFDTDYAGRLVLGRHWRTASPEKRQQFIDAFYNFLLRNYAKYVVRFEKENVRILPPGKQSDPDRALVKTEMTLDDGTKVPVHYSFYRTPKGWRAYDVRIEGISYVTNYRKQFDAEISQKGLDAVIERLRRESADLESKQATNGIDGADRPVP